MASTSPLMLSWRFAPLFWTQFFSAFNDNFLKNSLVFLILFRIGGAQAESLITLAGAIFIAPYFFLSALGGEMADRFDKAIVAQRLKLVEIAVAGLAVAGFVTHSIVILFIALFGFGVIGALFGPIKYGILPDHLERRELPAGNAWVEGATFVAILLGTIAGGIAAKNGGTPETFSGLVLLFALLCWVSSLLIPRTGEAAPNLIINKNIAASTWELIQHLRSDSRLWWGALVTSWFWLVGIVVLSLLPPVVKNLVGGNEETVTAYLAIFSIAVAVGSGFAAWLSSGRIVLLPTLLGAVLLGAFSLFLGFSVYGVEPTTTLAGPATVFATARGVNVAIALIGLAIGGGLFIVPAFAAVQAWAGADRRARVVAAVNVLNALFMTGATLFVALLQANGVGTAMLLLGLGVCNLLIAVVIGFTMPTRPFNDALSILYRAFFGVEVTGLDNLSKIKSPNVIIALNHVSFLDAGIALSLLGRDPVFAVDSGIAQKWWVKPFLRMTRAMPLDPLKPMATRTLIHAVQGGETLIIFPEGRITVTGSLMKVYDGAGLIADKSDATIVPVRIDGLEQTPFSRLNKQQVHKRWFPKVRVSVLEPVKLNVDPALRGKRRRRAAGAALFQIMSDMIYRTTPTDRTLVQALIAAAKEHGMDRVAVEDPVTGELTYKRLLRAVSVLGRKLMPLADQGKPVGVMLPSANAAVVTIMGLMSAGRVPAMINFTAGAANIMAGCRAAGVKTIVTARGFIERGRLEPLVAKLAEEMSIVYLEDVRKTVGLFDKLRALFTANKPIVARKADDWATILFTSGSEGVPKGVVLSHRNILTNAAQARASLDFGRTDKVFNILPAFHSFGLTVGLILPLIFGVRIFLYPSPLHYRTVPELIYGNNATILFGTDTFLNGYARAANPYDLRSIRYILSGAEPVKEATRRIYLEKFGLRILEGYGVTETAPALALNTPMFNKFGTVGRLLPGMEYKLEKVEGVDEGGRLVVKGKNVMIGYLRAENPGVLERPPEGWYDTGDIVTVDDEGFITIRGRAKRFAKVGGEMISLAAVEMLAGDLWPESVSAVVTIPDARKGERLLLYTNKKDANRSEFMTFARERHASELMIPAEVIYMEKLPLLGSGKVDLINLAKIAASAPRSARRQSPDVADRVDGALPERLRRILEADYPRFSAGEMSRRRAAIELLLKENGADHLVFCGANRFGSAVQWLTQWPVTAEAVGVFSPGKPDALFVQYFNHVPLARRLADKAEVAWGAESSIATAIAALEKRGAKSDRVAVIGPMNFEQHATLSSRFGKLVNLNKSYIRLRLVKSDEELDWLRIGAHFSDLGMAGLRDGLKPGLSERELGDLVERAYVGRGGTNWIHYFGVTPMRDPQVCVPAQFPSTQCVQQGDVVFAEISAAFFDQAGQVLRSFAVGEEPTPLYRDLHAAADAAYDAIARVLKAGTTPARATAASAVIEDAGFTTCDDLLHGYGGGYLPPVLGSRSRPAGPVPDEPFQANQVVVIQPNVVTRDGKAGVQTGEMVVITKDGIERMHAFPRGFIQV